MFTAILLSIILNGYIVIRFTTYHFIRLHRFKGQLLYLKTIAIGFFTYLFALCFALYFKLTFVFDFVNSNQNIHIDNNVKPIIGLAFLSFIISWVWVFVEELWHMFKIQFKSGFNIELCQLRKKTRIFLTYKLLQDSPLDTMLFESMANDKYLLITMLDRKCYVGRVVNLGEPNEQDGPDQEILVVPISSGYRDNDTLELKLTTIYNLVDSSIKDELTIVLKQHNIVSACDFHDNLYQKISNKKIVSE
ncbi:hypothetical protein QM435_05015 [Legionella pneumophila]|nr:hypothetical protein [Legionella pneumophila]MDI9844512.1 hypothetical protein [Legionella pneumophila]